MRFAGVGEPELLQQLLRPGLRRPAPEVVEPPDHVEVLVPGQVLVDRGVLPRQADPLTDLLRLAQDVDARDERATGVRLQQRGEHSDTRGLACTVGPEQAQDGALGNLEVEPVQGPDLSVSLDQAFGRHCCRPHVTNLEPAPDKITIIYHPCTQSDHIGPVRGTPDGGSSGPLAAWLSMCGLAGEVRLDGSRADVAAVERMAATMSDRGPDDAGLWSSGRVALGHRRLKIIDLSAASGQPITDSDAGVTGVFNGCIYNYRELRAELQAKGHRFFSHGDSEVVLKAYTEWGARLRRPPDRHVRRRDRRARLRPRRPRPRPARHQAAVRRGDPGRAALREHAARAARRRRHRHLDRPGRARALPELPQHRAAAADDPPRRHEAAAGDGPRHRARRRHPRPHASGRPTSPGTRTAPAGRSSTGRRRCCRR